MLLLVALALFAPCSGPTLRHRQWPWKWLGAKSLQSPFSRTECGERQPILPEKAVSTSEQVTIVGLTGGIATGKSTVTRMFRDLGVVVIDADVVAREVVEPGQPALTEIRDAFGDSVIAADGTLNRAALGAIVFEDDEARRRLGAITHPRIGMRMLQLANEAHEQGHDWVIYDAALLIENNIHTMLPGTIVVACSPENQLARLMTRDEFDAEEAIARIQSQLPLAEKVAVADWVIDNDGTREQTEEQVRELFAELQSRFAR